MLVKMKYWMREKGLLMLWLLLLEDLLNSFMKKNNIGYNKN